MMAPMDITKVTNSNTPRISPAIIIASVYELDSKKGKDIQFSNDGVNVRLINTSSLPCNMMLIATENPPNASKAKSKNAQTPINRFDTIIARVFSPAAIR